MKHDSIDIIPSRASLFRSILRCLQYVDFSLISVSFYVVFLFPAPFPSYSLTELPFIRVLRNTPFVADEWNKPLTSFWHTQQNGRPPPTPASSPLSPNLLRMCVYVCEQLWTEFSRDWASDSLLSSLCKMVEFASPLKGSPRVNCLDIAGRLSSLFIYSAIFLINSFKRDFYNYIHKRTSCFKKQAILIIYIGFNRAWTDELVL